MTQKTKDYIIHYLAEVLRFGTAVLAGLWIAEHVFGVK